VETPKEVSFVFCKTCKRKKCLKTGRLCKKVDDWMRKQKIYSSDYIRPEMSRKRRNSGLGRHREVPFSSIKWDEDRNMPTKYEKT